MQNLHALLQRFSTLGLTGQVLREQRNACGRELSGRSEKTLKRLTDPAHACNDLDSKWRRMNSIAKMESWMEKIAGSAAGYVIIGGMA
jgi:hypothetical protein